MDTSMEMEQPRESERPSRTCVKCAKTFIPELGSKVCLKCEALPIPGIATALSAIGSFVTLLGPAIAVISFFIWEGTDYASDAGKRAAAVAGMVIGAEGALSGLLFLAAAEVITTLRHIFVKLSARSNAN